MASVCTPEQLATIVDFIRSTDQSQAQGSDLSWNVGSALASVAGLALSIGPFCEWFHTTSASHLSSLMAGELQKTREILGRLANQDLLDSNFVHRTELALNKLERQIIMAQSEASAVGTWHNRFPYFCGIRPKILGLLAETREHYGEIITTSVGHIHYGRIPNGMQMLAEFSGNPSIGTRVVMGVNARTDACVRLEAGVLTAGNATLTPQGVVEDLVDTTSAPVYVPMSPIPSQSRR